MSNAKENDDVARGFAVSIGTFTMAIDQKAVRGKFEFVVECSIGPINSSWSTHTCKQLYHEFSALHSNKVRCQGMNLTIIPNHSGENDSGLQIDDAEVESLLTNAKTSAHWSPLPRNDESFTKYMKPQLKTRGKYAITRLDFLLIFHP